MNFTSNHRWPISLTYFISNNCNYSCLHCNVKKGSTLSKKIGYLKDFKKELQKLKSIGYSNIVFTGGEPFLASNLVEDIQFALNIGYTITVFTNGSIFNEIILKKIKESNGRIIISLHGLRDYHDEFVRQKGAFDSALTLLEYCNKNNIQTEVNTSVNIENQFEINELNRLLADFNVNKHVLLYTSPIGFAKHQKFIFNLERWYDYIHNFDSYDRKVPLYAELMVMTREEWVLLSESEKEKTKCSIPKNKRISIISKDQFANCPINASNSQNWSKEYLSKGIFSSWKTINPNCPAHALELDVEKYIRICPFYTKKI
ncbi:MAG: radical SAM protein [Fermentimonas sp.]|nr:radical SAM protein [Dysgonamonadaceae bacterium]MDD4697749.1 radical SAM protein [Fermentimonas sp.]